MEVLDYFHIPWLMSVLIIVNGSCDPKHLEGNRFSTSHLHKPAVAFQGCRQEYIPVLFEDIISYSIIIALWPLIDFSPHILNLVTSLCKSKEIFLDYLDIKKKHIHTVSYSVVILPLHYFFLLNLLRIFNNEDGRSVLLWLGRKMQSYVNHRIQLTELSQLKV